MADKVIEVKSYPLADAMLRRCGELYLRWLQLAHEDREAGISYEAPDGAGHLAYLEYEAEVTRLSAIPLPDPRPWGWLNSGGGLTCCAETWGALTGALGNYDRTRPWPTVWPATREEAYAAMGWEWEPEPTEEEIAQMQLIFKAMWRCTENGQHGEEMPMPFGLRGHSYLLGEEYFTELAANIREIEAEEGEACG